MTSAFSMKPAELEVRKAPAVLVVFSFSFGVSGCVAQGPGFVEEPFRYTRAELGGRVVFESVRLF